MVRKTIHLIIISLLLSHNLWSQYANIRFENLDKKDGLSHSLITSIVQDDLGYLWVGTQDGLNRYNGYEFKKYRPSAETNSIYHHFIHCLFKDSNGKIWIRYHKEGLSTYDPQSEKFQNYFYNSNEEHSISNDYATVEPYLSKNFFFEDINQQLWIATDKGLNRYRPATDDFERIYFKGLSKKMEQAPITSMTCDQDGNLWLGSTFGLIKYNPDTKRSALIIKIDKSSDDIISTILVDQSGIIWAGSRENGLYKIEKKDIGKTYTIDNYNEELKVHSQEVGVLNILEDHQANLWFASTDGLFFLNKKQKKTSLQSQLIKIISVQAAKFRFLLQDGQDNIWLGSEEAKMLWRINPHSLATQSFEHAPKDKNSLGTNKVNFIFEDDKSVLWIGHQKGGLTKVNLFENQFVHLNNSKKATNLMPYNSVYSIHVDDKNNLLLGTYDGLYVFNQSTRVQSVLFQKDKRTGINFSKSSYPSGQLVGVMEPAADGKLWLGYFDYKISKFDLEKNIFQNFQHYPDHADAFNLWSMRSICTTTDGHTYFGATNGLAKLKADGEHFTYYYPDKNDPFSLSNEWIYIIEEDHKGILWIGTNNGGLNRFDPSTQKFQYFQHDAADPNSISSNTVKCIYEQKTNSSYRLWIGTGNGLNLFDEQSGKFSSYYVADGLPSNIIQSIMEDEQGRLWLSTNNGLSCFDPAQKVFINYTEEDGLQDNEFNEGARFKDKEGNLYFGGVNGLTIFHPDSLKANPFIPNIVLSEFKINNQIVNQGDTISGNVLLENAIEYTKQITLTPNEKVISFSYSAFHFAAPSKIRYRHRLVPFQNEWTENSPQLRYINYTNLPAGDYQLQIECSNLEGVWGASTKELNIKILPVFWKTTWFKILLLSSILLIIFSIIRLRTQVFQNQKKILSRQVKERTIALQKKSNQLKQSYIELQNRQTVIINQHKMIEQQRDHLKIHNQELKNQKEAIQLMADRLHESDQSKLSFFTNISHEFRTPLSLVIGQTEMLLEKNNFDDISKIKEDLSLMYRNEKRLLRLINQLLEIRKANAGKLKIKRAALDIIDFSQQLLILFRPLALRQNINLQFKKSHPEIWGKFDADKLEKIFFNLISNAFKHTNKTGNITIELEKTNPPQQLIIRIINSGKAIPKEKLAHIFDRYFYTTKENFNQELSTGIGLSLVKDLVNQHEGEIKVKQVEGLICFEVILPIIDIQKTKLIPLPTTRTFAFTNAMIEDPKEIMAINSTSNEQHELLDIGEELASILIVEDNPDMLSFLSKALEKRYKIITAKNGKIGLQLARQHMPNIIISDVMMPHMNGLELTQILKADVITSHIPTILLTAKVAKDDLLVGLKTGALDYLTKPFNTKVLLLKIENILSIQNSLSQSIRQGLPSISKQLNVKTIDHGLLDKVVKFIEENINDEKLNGDKLAQAVGMSKGSLYRKLKGLTGMTVNIFIRTFRLKLAAQLFQQGNYNITEVAYSVGFDNPKYFSVCFKQLFKKTPREYMNSYKNS